MEVVIEHGNGDDENKSQMAHLAEELLEFSSHSVMQLVAVISKERLSEIGSRLAMPTTDSEMLTLRQEAFYWRSAPFLFNRCANEVRLWGRRKEDTAKISLRQTRQKLDLTQDIL